MGWFTGIVVYILIWWTTLFAVLPFWVSKDTEIPVGHESGAPVTPHLKKKFLVTTAISVVLWLVLYICIRMDLIDFRAISAAMLQQDLQ